MASNNNARPETPASPLRGKYLVKNPYANAALRFIDFVLNTFAFGKRKKNTSSLTPRRILIGNAGHLGDVLIFTSVFDAVRNQFPNAEIGVLLGSWAIPIVKNDQRIRWLHLVDHWKLNRSAAPLFQKVGRYLSSYWKALHEIKKVNYDVAIDFYYYYPNFVSLLWLARIPSRIAYGSGGFGPLLTEEVKWADQDCHVVDYHKALLQRVCIRESILTRMRPAVEVMSESQDNRLPASSFTHGYVVLHIGTGSSQREWPLENWKSLAAGLTQDGHFLVFTGTGEKENDKIQSVIGDLDNCLNLCNELSWSAFVAIVADARLLVGVESLAGHLAAAVDTPCVYIKSGITHPSHWVPLSELARVLTNDVSCAPCYRSSGCSMMDCVRGIQPFSVHSTCKALLEGNKRGSGR